MSINTRKKAFEHTVGKDKMLVTSIFFPIIFFLPIHEEIPLFKLECLVIKPA